MYLSTFISYICIPILYNNCKVWKWNQNIGPLSTYKQIHILVYLFFLSTSLTIPIELDLFYCTYTYSEWKILMLILKSELLLLFLLIPKVWYQCMISITKMREFTRILYTTLICIMYTLIFKSIIVNSLLSLIHYIIWISLRLFHISISFFRLFDI